MTVHYLQQGGGANTNAANHMYPAKSGTNAKTHSYAEHFRELAYRVTRKFDFRRPSANVKGGGNQADVCYFMDHPVAVGDEIATNLLIPNTVLQAVSFGIESPLAGFVFTVKVKNAGVTIASAVSTATVATNTSGTAVATWLPITTPAVPAAPPAAGTPAHQGLFIRDTDYLVLVVDALPAAGLVSPTTAAGLQMWITAHVLDLNHGNA